jgi:hypothetical protein
MPQIDEKDIAKLIVFMAKAGYGVTAGETLPSLFERRQDVDMSKARAIAAIPSLLAKPILCTKKWEIIDGDHRHAAHQVSNTLVPFIQFDVSFTEALGLMAVFPFAYELDEYTPERN